MRDERSVESHELVDETKTESPDSEEPTRSRYTVPVGVKLSGAIPPVSTMSPSGVSTGAVKYPMLASESEW